MEHLSEQVYPIDKSHKDWSNALHHYHVVTNCLDEPNIGTNDAAQISVAMGGYSIFPHLLSDGTEPDGLAKCNGHETDDMVSAITPGPRDRAPFSTNSKWK